MILIDANLLLYAYHPASAQHHASRTWLERTLSDAPLVRIAWLTVWAFLRISTNQRVFERPLSGSEAESIVSGWLDLPTVDILEPGERYWGLFHRLMRESQAVGPLVMDAALAALAIEHGATLHTTDRDFSRFPSLKWIDPLANAGGGAR